MMIIMISIIIIIIFIIIMILIILHFIIIILMFISLSSSLLREASINGFLDFWSCSLMPSGGISQYIFFRPRPCADESP